MENVKIFQNPRISLFECNLFEIVPETPGVYVLGDIDMTCFYVGSSKNLRERLYQHRSMLKNFKHENKNLQDLYNNLTGKIYFIILQIETLESSRLIEQFLIDNPPTETKICNIAIDANCSPKGLSVSQEVRNKISKSSVGHKKSSEFKTKLKNFWSNPEQRERIRLQNLGTKHTKEMSEKKSLSLSKPVEINGKVYPSSKAAAEELKISRSIISLKINSDRYTDWKRL